MVEIIEMVMCSDDSDDVWLWCSALTYGGECGGSGSGSGDEGGGVLRQLHLLTLPQQNKQARGGRGGTGKEVQVYVCMYVCLPSPPHTQNPMS